MFRFGCVLLVCAALSTAAHGFDYEDLVELIHQRELTALDQVLEHLPGEYMDNFTLAFGSRSLHGSSYDYPRVILFGRDAKLILTFNGDPSQHKYHELEVVQFRDQVSEFEMHSISFTDRVRFSGRNPAVCLTCHGENPRPIWSSYEYSDIEDVVHWPGFYGSIHDAPGLRAEESEAYERFRSLASGHPRYRLLALTHPQSRWYPYGEGAYEHRFRPNNRLGNLLARLNAKRIARGLMQGEFFARYPNLSLLWLLRCPQAEDAATLDFARRLYDQRYASLSHIELAEYQSRSLEQVSFVFEKLLSGLEIFTWNLNLSPAPDDPRFFTGIVSIDELVAAAVLEDMPQDHWLVEFYAPWTQRQLYDTFRQGYYDANVAPGGIGEIYEALGSFYDRERAREACPRLWQDASREMTVGDG